MAPLLADGLADPATDKRDGRHRVAQGEHPEVSRPAPATDDGADRCLVTADPLPRCPCLAERDHALAPVDLFGLRTKRQVGERRVETPRAVNAACVREAEVRRD